MNGIERLKVLAEGQDDKALLKVVDYLLTREDLDKYYLNEEKSLKNMVDYIKETARKQCKNVYCYVEDEVVYEWAADYFIKTDEELGIKKINTRIPNEMENKKIEPEIKTHGQLSLF